MGGGEEEGGVAIEDPATGIAEKRLGALASHPWSNSGESWRYDSKPRGGRVAPNLKLAGKPRGKMEAARMKGSGRGRWVLGRLRGGFGQ